MEAQADGDERAGGSDQLSLSAPRFRAAGASKLDFRPALAYTYGAMHVVYILRCDDGTLYTGAAKDLARRLAQHAAGRASRYTRARLPVTLLWSRRERSWSHALQTEHWIKQLPRDAKDAIVHGGRLRVRRRSTRPRARR